MMNYKGQTAFIVGGSSGIGLAAARILAAGGATVALFARDEKKLADARWEVRNAASGYGGVYAWSMDASDYQAVEQCLGRAMEELGPPSWLINCAGRAIPMAFGDIPVEQLEQTLRQNLHTAWNTCKYIVPFMKHGGRIVNVSSVAGFIGVYGYTDYCASKFAVLGFSEALRGELKPKGISVSCLCPPDTDTPALAEENKTKPPETRAISGQAGLMKPDDVAEAMLAGASKGAFLITPGPEARKAYWVKRIIPGMAMKIMDSIIQKARTKPS